MRARRSCPRSASVAAFALARARPLANGSAGAAAALQLLQQGGCCHRKRTAPEETTVTAASAAAAEAAAAVAATVAPAPAGLASSAAPFQQLGPFSFVSTQSLTGSLVPAPQSDRYRQRCAAESALPQRQVSSNTWRWQALSATTQSALTWQKPRLQPATAACSSQISFRRRLPFLFPFPFPEAIVAAGAKRPLSCASSLDGGRDVVDEGVKEVGEGETCGDVDEREEMEYDVVVVGGGPAGLAAAIRLKQLCSDVSVCVVEKGAQLGSHNLSGNVFEPRALTELLPDWKDLEAPISVPVTKDRFRFLLSSSSHVSLPPPGSNHGNYVISLSELVRWMGQQAESMGVEVYTGISAARPLYVNTGGTGRGGSKRVGGVVTGDVGWRKDGTKKDSFEPGMLLKARLTLLAEGCRGSLSQEIMKEYGLREKAGAQHQTYALGVKEVWEVDENKHRPGEVVHTIGYPLDWSTYGGGFLYHMDRRMVALGLVVALDYSNPLLSIYNEFQKWKLHPSVRSVIEGGTVVQYGARTLNEGGLQSIPELVFPGGALIGCSAGFLNVPKIKGSHTAIKSGMLAAEAAARGFLKLTRSADAAPPSVAVAADSGGAAEALETPAAASAAATDDSVVDESMRQYPASVKSSWVWEELYKARNVRPGFHYGLLPGIINSAFEVYISRGLSPWTLRHGTPDYATLRELSTNPPTPQYPKPDNRITFDILTSVYRSSTNHNHDQPPHLKLRDSSLPMAVNRPIYGGPESLYCPAKVYEYVKDDQGNERLNINAQNCLHCKACDIKDPRQNIVWTAPEGGGGPGYTVM